MVGGLATGQGRPPRHTTALTTPPEKDRTVRRLDGQDRSGDSGQSGGQVGGGQVAVRWSGQVVRWSGQVVRWSGGQVVSGGGQVSQVSVSVPSVVFGTSLCKKRAKPS